MRVIAVSVLLLAALQVKPAGAQSTVPLTSSGGDGNGKATGWHVESRPLWRLQLRSAGYGAEAGEGLGGSGGQTSPSLSGRAAYRMPLDGLSEGGKTIGYLFGLGEHERDTVGLNLQVAPEFGDAYERLLLQPGVEYQTPLSSSVQLNARLFSTYASDGTPTDRREVARSGGDGPSGGGFRDVGLGIGIDYSVTSRWVVQTQAGMSRQLDATRGADKGEDQRATHQFFGGVIVNYRF